LAYTLFVCEAQPIAVEGLHRVLDREEFVIIGHAPALSEALPAIASLRPDIVLIGQSNPPRPLLPQIPQLVAESAESRIILWVVESAEQETFRALHGGARAVIAKTVPVPLLLECLRIVASGQVWVEAAQGAAAGLNKPNAMFRITPREREIIQLICQGLKNREISDILGITPGTVKVHLMHIFEKTGTKDRFQLALKARQEFVAGGEVPPSDLQEIANSI